MSEAYSCDVDSSARIGVAQHIKNDTTKRVECIFDDELLKDGISKSAHQSASFLGNTILFKSKRGCTVGEVGELLTERQKTLDTLHPMPQEPIDIFDSVIEDELSQNNEVRNNQAYIERNSLHNSSFEFSEGRLAANRIRLNNITQSDIEKFDTKTLTVIENEEDLYRATEKLVEGMIEKDKADRVLQGS